MLFDSIKNNFKYYTGSLNKNFNNLKNGSYNLVARHYVGARSFFLFILILYKFKGFFENPSLLNDRKYLNDIKKNILDCGCISIKFTQWIVSKLKGSDNNEKYKQIIEELEELFDNCKYHDFDYTKEIFQQSFKTDIGELIDINTIEVIASGSIGQVYRAKFKDTKQFNFEDDIVIKVKHPNIELIKSYQMILINFLNLLQMNSYCKNRLQLHINFMDFIDLLNKQIDFNIEASNTNKFYETYKTNDFVVVPKIFKYNSDIIISSFEDGEYFFNISEYQKNKVAINLLSLVSDMALIQNFMHGDLHIKNWKVRKFGSNYQIVLYDFGICFDGPNIKYNQDLWNAGETQNVRAMVELFVLNNTHIELTNKTDKEKLIEILMNTFTEICEEPFNMNIVFNKLVYIFSVNNIVINSVFLNICVFMCLIEDVFKKTNLLCVNYNKKLNMFKISKNQKLDMIAFCKSHNVYPELQEYLENRLIVLTKEENDTIKKKIGNNELEERDKIRLFDTSELSNITFLNPDEV